MKTLLISPFFESQNTIYFPEPTLTLLFYSTSTLIKLLIGIYVQIMTQLLHTASGEGRRMADITASPNKAVTGNNNTVRFFTTYHSSCCCDPRDAICKQTVKLKKQIYNVFLSLDCMIQRHVLLLNNGAVYFNENAVFKSKLITIIHFFEV